MSYVTFVVPIHGRLEFVLSGTGCSWGYYVTGIGSMAVLLLLYKKVFASCAYMCVDYYVSFLLLIDVNQLAENALSMPY